ncbi:hypothetical protein [Psychrobacter aquimaris]|uniref:hypothetical protein n=1 Tax=Psychrobacter aquimaris TaxID=292733 RepID=UPI003FD50D88
MNQSQYNNLLAEINTVEDFLANMPENRFLERMSFEARLDDLQNQLERVDVLRINKKAIITFRGKPVDRSHGIAADFSGKAINGLNEMVTSVVASLNNNLNLMGPIPNRDQHQLMITGTAVGSFGFELELPKPNYDIFAEKNGAEAALSDIQSLLRETIDGTDDDIGNIISKIHPRAVRKISDFLVILQRNEALFAMEYDKYIFRVETDEQLEAIINRLDNSNIREEYQTYEGVFQGFLPDSRTFEFVDRSNQEIIKGKIDASILNPEAINNDYLNKLVKVTFNVVQFGQAKPKYTLLNLADIII